MAIKTLITIIFVVNLVIRDMFVEGKEDIENSSNGKQCNITIYIYVYQIFFIKSLVYNIFTQFVDYN